ncbi:hypothetical protein ACJ41O_013277 [Fusarium nematophilum]
MRLLHSSRLHLRTFFGNEIPPYAILSHTWDQDEFLYNHLRSGLAELQLLQTLKTSSTRHQPPTMTRGLYKVLMTCLTAEHLGLEWVWVDTCCIDKSSSTELSESINSMFRWYAKSAICFAFLEDVTLEPDGKFPALEQSRWFTRGWTLQELIAPHRILFYGRNWGFLGPSNHILPRLAAITGIKEALLDNCEKSLPSNQSAPSGQKLCCCSVRRDVSAVLQNESAVTKMKWAATRRLTREEDIAYCLLGIFNVNMPLIYGEGAVQAFYRLQREIINSVADQSLLLFLDPGDAVESRDTCSSRTTTTLLAEHPSWFLHSGTIERIQRRGRAVMFSESPSRIAVDVILVPCDITIRYKRPEPQNLSSFADELTVRNLRLAVLDCHVEGDVRKRPAILVSSAGHRELRGMSVVLSAGSEDTPKIIGGPGTFTNGGAVTYVPDSTTVVIKNGEQWAPRAPEPRNMLTADASKMVKAIPSFRNSIYTRARGASL